ncbi:DUF882 domain-containing protein [[Haemophilus] felis]|nr:DUF882 domain-containing protein [[Haemophilus] felis]
MLKAYQLHSVKTMSLLISFFASFSVFANETVSGEVLPDQIAVEQKVPLQLNTAEQDKMAQQYSNEQVLDEKFPQLKLLFKQKIAELYADNNYQSLWNDEQSIRQFLYDYSALAISGVSKSSWEQLVKLDAAPLNSLERDILLTDSFLDYLYYADNLNKFAQKWLYDKGYYATTLPADERIEAWLSALKQSRSLDFLNSLSNHNYLYNQTLASLPNYMANLNDKNALAKLYKMAANIQRLRVIPEFKNGLFVNIPSYKLYYYRNGELVLDSKVIVGKKERKTPVMYSKLSNVVVNPPWNAPIRLINEDIIPKVRKDPSYIYRNGYTIIFRIDGVSLAKIRQAAEKLRSGGVGFYPRSNFVHVDTGPVRTWRGS